MASAIFWVIGFLVTGSYWSVPVLPYAPVPVLRVVS
jgi:hypothetical protein